MLAATMSAEAQTDSILVVGKDTVSYRYTPITAQPKVESKAQRAWRRFSNYILESAIDRSFERKMDFTILPGVYYTNSTNFGFALVAAGLYRIDRTNRDIAPSSISVYGNVSINGYYRLGVKNSNIFRNNRNRLDCNIDLRSQPTYFWGIGYNNAVTNQRTKYLAKLYHVDINYRHRFLKHLYLGGAIDFDCHNTRRESEQMQEWLGDRKGDYFGTGISLVLEYDSRDNINSPHRGLYISLRGMVRPDALGNTSSTLWTAAATIDYYQPLWRGAILALDLYGEFNFGDMPWVFYPTLGGSHRMRGYYEGQFSDRNAVMLQLELRQRIWRQLGIAVWGGAGNVFHSFAEFRWRHTLPNYGIGLRWELKNRLNVRIDYGLGGKVQGRLINGVVFSIGEAF